MEKFPLLRLKDEAMRNVILNMEFLDLFPFTLCSRKIKNIVKQQNLMKVVLDMTITTSYVEVYTTFYGDVNCFVFHHNETDEKQDMSDSRCEWIYDEDDEDELVDEEDSIYSMEIREYIDYIFDIFHLRKIYELSFRDGFREYHFETIVKVLDGIEIQKFVYFIERPDEMDPTIFKTFLPTKQVGLYSKPTVNILQQNFDSLEFGHHYGPIALDDLLTINSKQILIRGSSLAEKQLNRFIKSWIRGSSSRLEYLKILFGRNTLDENILMKRINCMKKEREFPMFDDILNEEIEPELLEGMDIRDKNGRLASILVKASADTVQFGFYIWT